MQLTAHGDRAKLNLAFISGHNFHASQITDKFNYISII